MNEVEEPCLRAGSTVGVSTPAGPDRITYQVAVDAGHVEQIHQLNYRTFVEEIPQHLPRESRHLVDRFHHENTYWVALDGDRVVGMVALRHRRPFSLDAKLSGLDGYLPRGSRPLEVRLLAVEPAYRKGPVCATLLRHAMDHGVSSGFDVGVISGTTRQAKLYRHLGFVPFGPLVGVPGAQFQPMYLTLRALGRSMHRSVLLRSMSNGRDLMARPLNLLPGPVHVSDSVQAALAEPALSHRGPQFASLFKDTRDRLCHLVGANHVQVLPGSGSLANAVVAAQLAASGRKGLVITNGEFGERLADTAGRQGLDHSVLRHDWLEKWDFARIERASEDCAPGDWVWCVHHETSTGRLNPLERLQELCGRRGLRLCVDAISSLGAVPVDLRRVALASGTSGKGLAGFPGLALVFHEETPLPPVGPVPAYLDLSFWSTHDGVPFTHSSNLVSALNAAVREVTPARMTQIMGKSGWLKAELGLLDVDLVITGTTACPGLVSFCLPAAVRSVEVGEELERRGFLLSFRSAHLLARNWLQISLLGNPPQGGLENLVHELSGLVGPRSSSASSHSKPIVGSRFPGILNSTLTQDA